MARGAAARARRRARRGAKRAQAQTAAGFEHGYEAAIEEQFEERLDLFAAERTPLAEIEGLAEAAGLDAMKASGKTGLPLTARDAAWDASAAEQSLAEGQYADAHFWRDPDGDPATLSAYKLPFAKADGGILTAVWKGVTACAGAIQGARGGVDIPDADVAGVKSKIESYYAAARKEYDDPTIRAPWDTASGSASLEEAAAALAYAEAGPDADALTAGRTAWTETLAGYEIAALAAEAFQYHVKCACGHGISLHLGNQGPCTHEDGRGTCRCSEYSEAPVDGTAGAVTAAAGDVAMGPEDGFRDLQRDIEEALESATAEGAIMYERFEVLDVAITLDRALVKDCLAGGIYVVPITVGDDSEPTVAAPDAWVPVEKGWVEVPAAPAQAPPALPPVALDQMSANNDPTVTGYRLRGEFVRRDGSRTFWYGANAQNATVSFDSVVPVQGPRTAVSEKRWTATIAFEGIPTDDRRAFAPGSLTWRELPLSLGVMFDTPHADVVTEARVCGRIDRIWRDGSAIRAEGIFDEGELGDKVAQMVSDKTLRGVSVDVAPQKVEVSLASRFLDEDGAWREGVEPDETGGDPLATMLSDEPPLQVYWEAVLGATTVCPFPAFADARIESDASLVAADVPGLVTMTLQAGWTVVDRPGPRAGRDVVEAIVASGEPGSPPLDWFYVPEADTLTPLTVTDDGRVFGHAAAWGTCHTGFPGVCVTAPTSDHGYDFFHLGERVCEHGDRVACGTITVDTGHADRRLGRRDTIRHYDDTGTAVAHVRAFDGEHGIWVCGALASTASPEQVETLQAAKLSGDWRDVDGNLELVALLCVNVPGFPVPRRAGIALAASASGPLVTALVAAGVHDGTAIVTADPDLDELREVIEALGQGQHTVAEQDAIDELSARAGLAETPVSGAGADADALGADDATPGPPEAEKPGESLPVASPEDDPDFAEALRLANLPLGE